MAKRPTRIDTLIDEHTNDTTSPTPPASPLQFTMGKDIFGTQGNYLGGMMYLSRMKIVESPKPNYKSSTSSSSNSSIDGRNEDESNPPIQNQNKKSKLNSSSTSPNDLPTSNSSKTSKTSKSSKTSTASSKTRPSSIETKIATQLDQQEPEDDLEYDVELQSKRDCALALCSLVGNTELMDKVLEDGMIDAFVSLASTPDPQIRMACSRALCRLTCNPSNWPQMINDGAILAIMSLSQSGARMHVNANAVNKMSPKSRAVSPATDVLDDQDVATQLCSIAIANLSCLEGSETQFINTNAYSELLRHCLPPLHNQRVLLSTARLLFNLCHVDTLYIGLEQIAQLVVRITKTVVKNGKKALQKRHSISKSSSRSYYTKSISLEQEWSNEMQILQQGKTNEPYMIEISLSCTNLADLDELSGSDPMVVVKQRHGGVVGEDEIGMTEVGPWLEGGRTEVIQNDRNPTFKKTFKMVVYPNEM